MVLVKTGWSLNVNILNCANLHTLQFVISRDNVVTLKIAGIFIMMEATRIFYAEDLIRNHFS